MKKEFFTKVSPKAVEGIRRVYETRGAEVRAKVGSDGNATVVVIWPNDEQRHVQKKSRFGRTQRQQASAA